MATKTAYMYDGNRLFTGTTEAHNSYKEPAVFLKPDNSSFTPIPLLAEHEAALHVKATDTWSVIPDFRGITAYDQTNGAAVVIEVHGALPVNLALTKPQVLLDAEAAAEKDQVLATFKALRSSLCNALGSISVRRANAGEIAIALVLDAASQGLLDIPAKPGVMGAIGGKATEAAILAEYNTIASTLVSTSPSAAAEFAKLGLTL